MAFKHLKNKVMTTQEIYQNMTKGEWDMNTTVLSEVVGKEKEYEANERAKVLAVNNTFGKGIHPENVSEYKNAGHLIVATATVGVDAVTIPKEHFERFKQALKNLEIKL